MSFITTHTGLSHGIDATYSESRPTRHDPTTIVPAYIRVEFVTDYGSATLHLTMEDARVLAEQLPGLLMAHDAAEHAAREQAAAIAEAA
ncbi:hypothetical protein [Nocardia mangyaensis]|nr:hypothetical protein [Nocardia mangyaensis]